MYFTLVVRGDGAEGLLFSQEKYHAVRSGAQSEAGRERHDGLERAQTCRRALRLSAPPRTSGPWQWTHEDGLTTTTLQLGLSLSKGSAFPERHSRTPPLRAPPPGFGKPLLHVNQFSLPRPRDRMISLASLAPGACFMEDSFSTDQGGQGCAGRFG